MSGLSDFITNTANQTTTMPAWYDAAQQAIVSKAGTAAGQMPTLQNTVAGQAINQLNNPNTNPFTQAEGTLGQIATGAANPWITDASGNVTPNTNTALGGLFQAQNQQLQQLMPNVTAQPNATGIGAGQFGSLRGQTAEDKAMADAQSALAAQQMQAALQNQQYGISAAQGLGQVGAQGASTMTTLGQAQQSDPFTAAANYGKIVGGIQAPTTVSNQTQLSPLNVIGGLASAGTAGYNAINSALSGTSYGSLGGLLGSLFGGSSGSGALPITDSQAATNAATVQANLPSNVNMQQYDAAINGWTQTGFDSSGNPTYVDASGQPV